MDAGHALVVGASSDIGRAIVARLLGRIDHREATPSTLVFIASGAAHRVFPGNAA